MKAFKYIVCLVMALAVFTQCKDYLESSNPGKTDDTFVTATTAETWKLLSWCYANYGNNVASGGNYNFQDPIGTDVEWYNEPNSANNVVARLQSEGTTTAALQGQFENLYSTLARAARIANAISQNAEYQADKEAGRTTEWTQLYGEAIGIWAHCYFKLTMHWGDVPFGIENTAASDYELSSRFEIHDQIIAALKEVEPLMWDLGEGTTTTGALNAERITRTYVNGLIGQINIFSAGWQTIRTDVEGLYGDLTFEVKYNDEGKKCQYARRQNYTAYYQEAVKYLELASGARKGSAELITVDPRAGVNNPFQYIWNEVNSRRVSPESLFEIGRFPGTGSAEHPYSQGRPASSSHGILNVYGAIRFTPHFYYAGYEAGDKRRDASMVPTGTQTSNGTEQLLKWGAATRLDGGGVGTNKWDRNKADDPGNALWVNASNRSSGVNYTVLRMADVILMLAEAKAWLGDNTALTHINQVRARAFGDNTHALSGLTGEALIDAVYAERKLELAGEGAIRHDMIRSGKFNERALESRRLLQEVTTGLTRDGYFTFSNGKTMPNYVFAKLVYLDGVSSTGVTFDAPNSTDPVLYPGWRGVTNWPAIGKPGVATDKHNLAIVGLDEYIDPNGSRAATLKAEGYEQKDWGIGIVNDMAAGGNKMFDQHLDGVVGREQLPPRYFHAMPAMIITQSKGKVTNGYGLPQN